MPEGYSVDVSKAVGYQFTPVTVACTRRDYLMYALAVGVPEEDLRYLYELDIDFGPLPSYPICLQLKGEDWDVNSFMERYSGGGPVPGIPPYDFNKVVHGEQSLEVIRPFPAMGGRFKAIRKIVGVYDKGSGMVIDSVTDMYGESDNVLYCRLGTQMFTRGYGGWNGPKGPKAPAYKPPNREADAIEKFETQRNQALLFRLSGDYNPLHADPNLAPAVGFERPILHGLCTYGRCCHAVLKRFADNDRLRLKDFRARFANPVLPGETVDIYMWKVDTPDPKTDGVIFVAKVKDRVVISNGYATLYKEPQPESKL